MVAFTYLPKWPFSIHHFFIPRAHVARWFIASRPNLLHMASRFWIPSFPFWHAGKTMSQVKYGIPRKPVKGKYFSSWRMV